MLECHAGPMECPIDESGGYEYDNRIRQHDAPVRKDPLIEMARHESRQPVGVINFRHYLGFSFISYLSLRSELSSLLA